MPFLQEAEGVFSVHVTGEYHCGPDHTSPKTFEYHVRAEYDDDQLDHRGFLADNLTYQQWFNSLGTIDISCEMLARRAATSFYNILEGRCIKLAVKIRAFRTENDAAWITYVLPHLRSDI